MGSARKSGRAGRVRLRKPSSSSLRKRGSRGRGPIRTSYAVSCAVRSLCGDRVRVQIAAAFAADPWREAGLVGRPDLIERGRPTEGGGWACQASNVHQRGCGRLLRGGWPTSILAQQRRGRQTKAPPASGARRVMFVAITGLPISLKLQAHHPNAHPRYRLHTRRRESLKKKSPAGVGQVP